MSKMTSDEIARELVTITLDSNASVAERVARRDELLDPVYAEGRKATGALIDTLIALFCSSVAARARDTKTTPEEYWQGLAPMLAETVRRRDEWLRDHGYTDTED
jgi:hypothetical protein